MIAHSSLRATEALRAEVLSDLASFEDIRPEWNSLFLHSGCENVFLTYEWLHEWWMCFGGGSELFLIAVRSWTGKLVGIAPFYRRRIAGLLHSLEFLGSRLVGSDHLSILIDEGFESEAIAEIVRVLVDHRKQWWYLQLADCDDGAPAMSKLRRQLCAAGLSEQVVERGTCPYVSLPADFDTYLASIHSRWRRNFRHGFRALSEAGHLEFVALEDATRIVGGYREAVDLHRQRFENLRQASVILPAAIQAFHHAAAKALADRGWGRLYLLLLNGRTIAALHGFAVGAKYVALQSGFDAARGRESAGTVVIGMAIEDCIRRGQKEFDFLRGAERYKFHWTRLARTSITLRYCHSSVPAAISCALAETRTLGGEMRRALQKLVGRTGPNKEPRT